MEKNEAQKASAWPEEDGDWAEEQPEDQDEEEEFEDLILDEAPLPPGGSQFGIP